MGDFAKGTAFLFAHPVNSDKLHLCITLTDPTGNPPSVVIVPVNSEGKDKSCELHVGDHEFIQHDSVVTYQLAVFRPVAVLERHEAASSAPFANLSFARKDAVAQSVLERIIAGALASKLTPRGIKQTLSDLNPNYLEQE